MVARGDYGRPAGERRPRWPLVAACGLLLLSCENPLATETTAVGRVDVEPKLVSLQTGGTADLTARVFDKHNREIVARVHWSSQNVAVATVSQTGLVTAVGPGVTQVAASAGGQAGIASVTVAPRPVALVRLTPTAGNVFIDATVQIIAEVLDGSGGVLTGRHLTWSSSDVAIATVSSTGLVRGVAVGTATIHASVEGVQGSAVITVAAVPIANITVSPLSAAILVSATQALSATARDENGTVLPNRTIVWSSSSDAVAAVSQTGVVTGVGAGSATVTAASPGGGFGGTTPQGSSTIAVSLVPVASVQLVPSSATITVGQTASFGLTLLDSSGQPLTSTGRTISWSSSSTSVATVTGLGTVTAVAAGTATITATVATPGQTSLPQGTAAVTVTNVPVASVQVTPPTVSLNVGQQSLLSATARDANGAVLTGWLVAWASTNTTVATVSPSGLVTAVATGAATVTATVATVSGSATVSVSTVPIATITVTPNPATVQERQTVTLTGIARDVNNNVLTGRTLVWSSTSNSIAAVAQTGVVTGISPGSSSISASAEGKTGSSAVTVSFAPVASVQVVPASATVPVGSTVTFTAHLFDAGSAPLSTAGRTVSWISLDPSKATVNASTGVATGVAVGSATIRASASSPGQGTPATGSAALSVSNVPVASVTVSPNPGTVHVGSLYTRQFSAVTRDAQNNVLTGRNVVWTSTNQAVATVDAAAGVVTGVATGSITITATSEGISGNSSVTVDLVPIQTVVVAPASASLIPLATQQLTATPRDSASNAITGTALGGRTTNWTTSNAAAATVNASTGLVTAVAQGSAMITATISGTSGTSVVTVLAPVSSLAFAVAPDSVILPGGLSGTLTVRDAASNPLSGRSVSLTSSHSSIATVAPPTATSNASGQVSVTITGVSAGTSTITATSETKVQTFVARILNAVATVTVTAPGDSIIDPLSGPGATLQASATLRDASNNVLAGRPISWSSSNNAIATVNPSTGLITSVAPGPVVTITALSEGKSGTLAVRILAPVNTVTVSAAGDSVIGTGTLQASAVLRDASNSIVTGRPVSWSSSNSGVATVNAATGLITGVAPGNVTITATSEGKSGTVAVRVLVGVASVPVAAPVDSLIGAGTLSATATVRDAATNPIPGRFVAITSSNTGVATVNPASATSNASGQVSITITRVANGNATITSTSGGVSGTLTVRMLAPVNSVTISPPSRTMTLNNAKPFTVSVTDAGSAGLAGRPCTISSNSLAASVSPTTANTNGSGQIALTVTTGLLPGSATITATCEGKSGTSTITVTP